MRSPSKLIVTLATFLLLSCDDNTESRTLLLSPDSGATTYSDIASTVSTTDDDEETKRLRDLQAVRIIGTGVASGAAPIDLTPAATAGLVYVQCWGEDNFYTYSPVVDDCDDIFRTAAAALCATGRLLEISSNGHAPYALNDILQILPQSAGARHSLAQVAGQYASWGGVLAAIGAAGSNVPDEWLYEPSINGPQPTWPYFVPETFTGPIHYCSPEELSSTAQKSGVSAVSLRERFAGIAGETYHLLFEAAELAGDLGLAVADAQLSDTSSRTEGLRRQMTATSLSRAAAAHMLVGGAPGLLGDVQPHNLCTANEPGDEVRQAIRLFREAGVSPEDISGETPLEDLVEDDFRLPGGALKTTACGSIRERLYQRWNSDPVLENTDIDLPTLFSLSIDDFRDAREYLRQEIRTFARSRTATLSTGDCAAATGNYPRYAATSTEPKDLDPVYWSTLLRYNPSASSSNVTGAVALSSNIGDIKFGPRLFMAPPADRGGFSAMIDNHFHILSAILGASSTTNAKNRGLLAMMLSDHENDRFGRLYILRWLDAAFAGSFGSTPVDHMTWAVMTGHLPSDGLIVVEGEDGLRCALYGSIEGAPCSNVQFTGLKRGTFSRNYLDDLETYGATLSMSARGGLTARNWALSQIRHVPEGKAAIAVMDTSSLLSAPPFTRLYVLKPRPGVGVNPGPGDYVAVTGFYHSNTGHDANGATVNIRVGNREVESFAVMPSIDRKAADYIRPNDEWCSRPQLTCAGGSFDDRLPLENELTDDGSDFESSWRHYLTLAKQAATEADMLGQDYLASEFGVLDGELAQLQEAGRVRERRERELETLQSICGTAIDSETLYETLVPFGDIASSQPTETCSEDDSCSTPNYDCIAGYCIRKLEGIARLGKSDPELSRLHECLSATNDSVFATPGTVPLCVVLGGGNQNRVCETDGPTPIPCPVDVAIDPDNPLTDEELDAFSCDPYLAEASTDKTRVVRPLGYFTKGVVSGPAAAELCTAYRRLRNNASGPAFSESIVDTYKPQLRSDLFFFETVQERARNIGWGPMWFSGEMAYRGVATYSPDRSGGWPCLSSSGQTQAPPGVAQSCLEIGDTTGQSFFCQNIDCNSVEQKAAWTTRSLSATMALRILAYDDSSPTTAFFTGVVDQQTIKPFEGVSMLHRGMPPAGHQIVEVLTNPWTNGSRLHRTHDVAGASDYWTMTVDGASTDLQLRVLGWSAGGLVQWALAPYSLPGEGDESLSLFVSDELFQFQPPPPGVGPHRAPFWWRGLSYSDSGLFLTPRVTGRDSGDCPLALTGAQANLFHHSPAHECVGPARDPYPNDAWISRYLSLGGGVVSPAPLAWPHAGQYSTIVGPQSRSLMPSYSADTTQAVLDAVELLCHYEAEFDVESDVVLETPPSVRGPEDLDDVARWFELVGDTINNEASALIFANLPRQALDAIKLNPTNSAFPALGGELSSGILELRGALISIAQIAPAIASEIQLIGTDIRNVHSRLEIINLERDLIDLRQLSTSLDRLTSCAQQTAELAGIETALKPGKGVSAAIGCANSMAQIVIAANVANVEDSIKDEEVRQAFTDFDIAMITRREALRRYADNLSAANETVNASLARIDNQRSAAKRALQRALFMHTEFAEKQAEISLAMRGRTKVARERYERALTNAKRMAFLAKRAIEQRLGVYLSELRDDLPLVDAPSTWEGRVCATTGIDFESFSAAATDQTGAEIGQFADQYIGDYVTKLENLVESYVLEYNFHEGDDVAVVSLRDDLSSLQDRCEVISNNLLYWSGELDHIVSPDPNMPTGVGSWFFAGCEDDADGVPLRDCVRAEKIAGESPISLALGAPAYEIAFGDDGSPCDLEATDPCGFQASSALMQIVPASGTTYLLSWYAQNGDEEEPSVVATGSSIGGGPETEMVEELNDGWARYATTFSTMPGDLVGVSVRQSDDEPSAIIAGLMLEDISDLALSQTVPPSRYMTTSDTLTHTLEGCKDNQVSGFGQGWRYQCAHLCPGGFAEACGRDSASTRCYYETSFSISQKGVEQGKLLRYSGFALGNFNYRFDKVAVNFVGTNVRLCDTSTGPGCNSAGFLSYSIQHDGPYYLRNHLGGTYEADLFTGNIEHARGLAAERVVTNPIGSADRDLLQDYQRSEFRGRPLDGTFTLRLWDEPGLNWAAIEDVQLVVDYRYWTRFD